MEITHFVEEELRLILIELSQHSPKTKELSVSTSWVSRKMTEFRQRWPAGAMCVVEILNTFSTQKHYNGSLDLKS